MLGSHCVSRAQKRMNQERKKNPKLEHSFNGGKEQEGSKK